MARKLVLTQCHPLTQRPKAHRLRMVQGTGSPGSVCRSTSPRSRGQPAAIRSKGIQNMSEWFLQDASIELKVQAFLDQTPVVNIGSSWIGWIQHHAFFTVLVRTRPMARTRLRFTKGSPRAPAEARYHVVTRWSGLSMFDPSHCHRLYALWSKHGKKRVWSSNHH